uniref:DNA-processing protein DprA n=1 Tax=Ningiella ruwaisensis TaxID=2364274 RepID=UPI00109FEDC7|nr:DNA-processing protein DprA [Ningiella ruwaisensis]
MDQVNTFNTALKNYSSNIEAYLVLDAISQMGIQGLQKTAQLFRCDIADIIFLDADQLRKANWSQTQIDELKQPKAATVAQLKRAIKWLESCDTHHFLPIDSPHYPDSLKELTRPPLFIFVKGDASLLNSPQLAVVGTRAPSQYAKEVVSLLLSEIGQTSDFAITSGMALGIDGIAHRIALDNQMPTLAVLGCGIDIAYPRRHSQLYQQIAEQGALVSEFVPSTPPHASLFPRRNRIISGLSQGVLVIEAKIKSGSLVTARYALEQNKEVFAVPSAIYNPQAEGCHFLIKQGAKLTENAKDILEELPGFENTAKKFQKNTQNLQKSASLDLASDPLLDSVSYSATSVDLIAKRSGMPISDVLTQLLQYELRGIVASTPEGYVKLRG